MAIAACRSGVGGSSSTSSSSTTPGSSDRDNSEKPFQYLQLVVRDWANFDDETWEDAETRQKFGVSGLPGGERWSEADCRAQMRLHLAQHFGEDVRERESVDTLKEMFGSISAYLLPNPGLKVAESKKRKWDGSLADIDEDFLRFVQNLCKDLFADGAVITQKVLGSELFVDSFVEVVETLAQAFSGMEVSQLSMVEAIGKAKNLVSKDEAERSYKKYMDKQLLLAKAGKSPELLAKDHATASDIAVGLFDKAATFGDVDAIKEAKITLQEAIGELFETYKKDNERRLEQALSAFAGLAAAAVIFFVLDRISDYACDWWLDTCVAMSRVFVMFYTSVLGIIGYHMYFLTKERGKTAAGLAGIEMGKQMIVVTELQVQNVMYYMKHQEAAKRDLNKAFNTAKEIGIDVMKHFEASADTAGGAGANATKKEKAIKVSPSSPSKNKKID